VAGKDKEIKDRDWDREMREVDKLLAKLPEADPTLGRGGGAPTVPRAYPAHGVPTPQSTGPAAAGARLTTWFRVGLGLMLGVGMLVWPYSHVCGAKLLFYMIGASTVTVAGVWAGVSSWKRRMGLAHLLSLGLVIWGLVLAAGVVLPRAGYTNQSALWFCPEPK
jgi:hypothetical protein